MCLPYTPDPASDEQVPLAKFPIQYPRVPGHEIVGEVVAIPPTEKYWKVGQRVGVGAQVWSCMKCEQCKNANENYCPHLVDTYNSQYQDGSWAHGGYADYIRAHEYFTFKIPAALKSSDAAPLLCAGITTYSPLVRAGVGRTAGATA